MFVFSETNFYNNKNYLCALLNPISFESEYFFYLNMPFMFLSSMLVERNLGIFYWTGAFLTNATVSALTTVGYHRHIGYKEVRKRGRMANFNGNLTLFWSSLFTTLAPNYVLIGGGAYSTVYFWHVLVMMAAIYFTQYNSNAGKSLAQVKRYDLYHCK